MQALHAPPPWRTRVAALLDDPVAQAVLARDGLAREDVFTILAPVAERLAARHREVRRAA